MFKQIALSANAIYQYGFLKVAVLNRSTERAMIGSFGRACFP